jgi:hypothetical protein
VVAGEDIVDALPGSRHQNDPNPLAVEENQVAHEERKEGFSHQGAFDLEHEGPFLESVDVLEHLPDQLNLSLKRLCLHSRRPGSSLPR